MTLIKFCGITRTEDAKLAAELGVNFLGFNFYHASKRRIEPSAAAAISRGLSPDIGRVGVFVNEEVSVVKQIARQAALGVLQFHGDEDADYLEQFREWTVIKALRIQSKADLERTVKFKNSAEHLLLDAFVAGEPGGTGKQISEDLLKEIHSMSLWSSSFLAGGLRPENVGEKVTAFKPYAVDVAGGIESAAGIKDAELMRRFVSAVQKA